MVVSDDFHSFGNFSYSILLNLFNDIISDLHKPLDRNTEGGSNYLYTMLYHRLTMKSETIRL